MTKKHADSLKAAKKEIVEEDKERVTQELKRKLKALKQSKKRTKELEEEIEQITAEGVEETGGGSTTWIYHGLPQTISVS